MLALSFIRMQITEMFICCCRSQVWKHRGKIYKVQWQRCLINQSQQRPSEIVYFSGLREIHAQIISNGPFPTFSKNKTRYQKTDLHHFTYRFGNVLNFYFFLWVGRGGMEAPLMYGCLQVSKCR